MKTKNDIFKKLTKSKYAQLEKEWREHNKALRQKHLHAEQFKTLDDYILYRFGAKQSRNKPFTEMSSQSRNVPRRKTPDIPSLSDTVRSNSTYKRESKQYTGTYVTGVATMHKSNLIPITSKEQAIEVSKMRRN